MSLRLYDSLRREKVVFKPLQEGHVRMYVCGLTVQSLAHIGHGRMMVVFDMVQRWLKTKGWRVTYVRNITDVDDKIIRKALEEGVTVGEVTSRNIRAMHDDLDRLGVERPTFEPRATEYIPQMLSLIETLQQKGLAYQGSDGDMNFSVRKFHGYGKLSGKSLDDLRAGERIAVNEGKQDPLDFVLWKSAKASEPGEVRWESPFGPGRPGWHIECSAMCSALIGQPFDIHGGGQDLQFPHHENEIAQSEGAHGQPLANLWMHNGPLRLNDEKMSKSLGNVLNLREALDRFSPETLRFFLLRAHYRSPVNFTASDVESAHQALARLYTALAKVPPVAAPAPGLRNGAATPASPDWQEPHALRFAAAMDDDLNTPEAFAALFDLANAVNRSQDAKLAQQLRAVGGSIGLLQDDPERFLKTGMGSSAAGAEDFSAIDALVAARWQAKASRDFKRADAIRAELLARGIAVEDSSQGSTWRHL